MRPDAKRAVELRMRVTRILGCADYMGRRSIPLGRGSVLLCMAVSRRSRMLPVMLSLMRDAMGERRGRGGEASHGSNQRGRESANE